MLSRFDASCWSFDVVYGAATAYEVAWCRNLGGGTFGPRQVIDAGAAAVVMVAIADVDGDGDVDVLSSTGVDLKISWYENTDGAGTFGARQVIRENLGGPWAVAAGDLDGDGDTDVVSTSWPSDPGVLSWYENDGTPGGPGDWTVHELSAPGDGLGAASLSVADLDRDGDRDIVVMRFNKIAWYENLDGAGSFATVAGLRARSLAFNAATVDITDQESAGRWRELLQGAGVKTARISGSGIFKDAASDETLRGYFFSGTVRDWQVIVPTCLLTLPAPLVADDGFHLGGMRAGQLREPIGKSVQFNRRVCRSQPSLCRGEPRGPAWLLGLGSDSRQSPDPAVEYRVSFGLRSLAPH